MSFPRLLFVICLVFFLVRNLFLSLGMPLWVAGDEMAHVDYALKLSRGHIPETMDRIEPELFELHKEHWDHRYLTEGERPDISDPQNLGLGAYCYQANHPPLPHLILAFFRKILQFLGLSLLLQIKFMRMISVLAALLGMLAILIELHKKPNLGAVYFMSLMCLPLLAQDMFFCVNNDVYSFLFGCLTVVGMLRLYEDPHSHKNWLLLSLVVALALWVKLTNILLLGLWVLFSLSLFIIKRDKKLILPSFMYFFLTLILSSPWYIFSQIRYHSIWATRIGADNLGVFNYYPSPFTLLSFWQFLRAFSRTFFRGEMLWQGEYFDLFSEGMNDVFLTLVPLFFIATGIFAGLRIVKSSADIQGRFFTLSGLAVVMALLYGHFLWGNIPYYHARLAMGSFYFLMFPLALGALKVFRSEKFAYATLFLGLFLYNFFYSLLLLIRVL
jgi:hypothetical protein